MSWKLCFLSLVLIVRFARSEMDEYLSESQQQCTTKSNLFACAKYRALRYVSSIGDSYGFTGNSSNPVRLVKLSRYEPGVDLFPTARQLSTDSEFTKFFKYVKRQANYYLGTQGVQFSLPEGAEIIESNEVSNEVEEGRGKKKKATMVLLPLLMLIKLFKIKVMLAIVLASVVFIKKAIMLGALVLPSIIQNLKACAKMQQQHHHHSAYHFDDHEHDDVGSYYGGGGYSKDYERAYNAYIKSKGQF